MNEAYDLLVIGGGINGAGIARDAAGRGLRVLRGQGHARFIGKPLDRFDKAQALGLLQEADDVAVLAAGEAVIEALLKLV